MSIIKECYQITIIYLCKNVGVNLNQREIDFFKQ